jgi:hypothetical protein
MPRCFAGLAATVSHDAGIPVREILLLCNRLRRSGGVEAEGTTYSLATLPSSRLEQGEQCMTSL